MIVKWNRVHREANEDVWITFMIVLKIRLQITAENIMIRDIRL